MKPPTIKPRASILLTSKTVMWRDMEAVRAACQGKPVRISGKMLDLNGCQLVGSKLPQPKEEDDEGSVPLRIMIPGFVLVGGSVRRIPGGVLFREEGVTVKDVDFLEIGEDGLSNIMDDSEDAAVVGCRFWGASDKSVQLNDARGLVFTGNEIYGGITGVRLQKTGSKLREIRTRRVEGNRFEGVDTAWNISGGVRVDAVEEEQWGQLHGGAASERRATGGGRLTSDR